ncbi:hypothetical protein ACJX0J_024597 [Zea mays]
MAISSLFSCEYYLGHVILTQRLDQYDSIIEAGDHEDSRYYNLIITNAVEFLFFLHQISYLFGKLNNSLIITNLQFKQQQQQQQQQQSLFQQVYSFLCIFLARFERKTKGRVA